VKSLAASHWFLVLVFTFVSITGETVIKTPDYYETGYKVYIGPKVRTRTRLSISIFDGNSSLILQLRWFPANSATL
jgi:hypothetical protein